MHIAFLTSEYVTEPNFAGGLSQYLGRVTTGLVRRGHKVVVFVTSEKTGELDYKGVTVRRIKTQRWLLLRCANFILNIIKRPRLIKSQQASSIAKGLDKALRKYSSEVRVDVIQAASWLATGLFASKNPVAPIVVRVSSYEALLQGYRGSELTVDKKLFCFLERKTIQHASAVYAPSKFIANEIRKRTGVIAKALNPPFSLESCSKQKQLGVNDIEGWSDYLLYFGRVSRYKGAEILVEAIKPLFSKLPDLRLVIAGPVNSDDPTAMSLILLAKKRPESVYYAGVLESDEIAILIQKAQIVVLPSLMDNLPNTCLEAMSQGKVVIGPDGVSFDEIIDDGKTGILFRKGSYISLRQSIIRAWELSEIDRNLIGEAAKKRISKMSPAIALKELEQFYEDVIDKWHRKIA